MTTGKGELAIPEEAAAAFVPTKEGEPQTPADCFERFAPLLLVRLGQLAEHFAQEPGGPVRPGLYPWGAIELPGGATAPAMVAAEGSPIELQGDVADAMAFMRTYIATRLASEQPSGVHITMIDSGMGSFPEFSGLIPDLLQIHGPRELRKVLTELEAYMLKVGQTGVVPDQSRVVALIWDNKPLQKDDAEILYRLMHRARSSGVTLLLYGVPHIDNTNTQRISFSGQGRATTPTTGNFPIRMQEPPSPKVISERVRDVVAAFQRGRSPIGFAEVLTSNREFWKGNSTNELRLPIGQTANGERIDLVFGDSLVNALVGGTAGGGKTTGILTALAAACARYPRNQLRFFGLDFKDGVSFNPLVGLTGNPPLPQAEVVGVNTDNHREFGLAMLIHLQQIKEERARLFKAAGVGSIIEYRKRHPDAELPRILVAVDEFQKLFATNDIVSTESLAILEDLLRQGRYVGMHFILSSQNPQVDGMWASSSPMWKLFATRVAYFGGEWVLDDNNAKAMEGIVAESYKAVLNTNIGHYDPSQKVIKGPNVQPEDQAQLLGVLGAAETMRREETGDTSPGLRIFDGDVVPSLTETDVRTVVAHSSQDEPKAIIGKRMRVEGHPKTVTLDEGPARNLAIFAARDAEGATKIIDSTTRPLAQLHAPGEARFTVVCLDRRTREHAARLHSDLQGQGHTAALATDEETATQLLGQVASEVTTTRTSQSPHYVIVYGADHRIHQTAGPDDETMPIQFPLTAILEEGPKRNTHAILWFRGGQTTANEGLNHFGSLRHLLGAWVTVDVPTEDLGSLPPDRYKGSWGGERRKGLALSFDVTDVNAGMPEVIQIYDYDPSD